MHTVNGETGRKLEIKIVYYLNPHKYDNVIIVKNNIFAINNKKYFFYIN